LRRSDIIAGTLVTVFGLVMIFIIVPIQINSSSEYGLDPKFFPDALLWLLVAMGALLVATRLRTQSDPADAGPQLDLQNWLFICVIAVFLVAIFIAINTLGFILAGVIMIVLLMLALMLHERHWIELVIVSFIAPFAIYYALYYFFSVQLPSGILFP
jgi:putative tricarboxylic transport membrane protein